MSSKWTSRKFWLAIIGTVYALVGTLGFDIPVDQIAVTEALLAVWIIVEGFIDSKKIKPQE